MEATADSPGRSTVFVRRLTCRRVVRLGIVAAALGAWVLIFTDRGGFAWAIAGSSFIGASAGHLAKGRKIALLPPLLGLASMLVTTLVAPARAAPESITVSIASDTPSSGVAARTLLLNCTITVDNPHYSKGAQGVIAKVRYTCFGNTFGTLSVTGRLYRYRPGTSGPYAPLRSNSATRSVGPSVSGTVYIPRAGVKGGACDSQLTYDASAWLRLSAAGQSKTGSTRSKSVHPNCP